MQPGILVISHGSREAGWVERVETAVRDAARMLETRTGGVPLEAAYLELVEGRLIQDGIDRLEASGVTDMLAIPLFVSAGSKHVNEIGWALGAVKELRCETELTPFRRAARLTYGRPIGDDPEIAQVLLDKVAPRSTHPAGETLLLIGHGNEVPALEEAWRQGLRGLAEQMRTLGGYAGADIALLRPNANEAAERVEALRRRWPSCRILAVPVLLSPGYFTAEAVPRRLCGLPCDYVETALLPHPKMAEWIVRQAVEWLGNLAGRGGRSAPGSGRSGTAWAGPDTGGP